MKKINMLIIGNVYLYYFKADIKSKLNFTRVRNIIEEYEKYLS